MASSGRPSVNKRNREQARKERTQEKEERRKQRGYDRQDRPNLAPGEDPDLAGIVHGPQPIPE